MSGIVPLPKGFEREFGAPNELYKFIKVGKSEGFWWYLGAGWPSGRGYPDTKQVNYKAEIKGYEGMFENLRVDLGMFDNVKSALSALKDATDDIHAEYMEATM